MQDPRLEGSGFQLAGVILSGRVSMRTWPEVWPEPSEREGRGAVEGVEMLRVRRLAGCLEGRGAYACLWEAPFLCPARRE